MEEAWSPTFLKVCICVAKEDDDDVRGVGTGRESTML